MKPVLLFLSGFLVLSTIRSEAAICTATTGNWENASTWSCGYVPTCNDQIVIPQGVSVTIGSTLSYPPASAQSMTISISGNLYLQPGQKLYLPSGSEIYLYVSGSIHVSSKSNSIGRIEIGNKTVWRSSEGTLHGATTLTDGTQPIEFLSFNAERCFEDVCLYWTTMMEHNNNFFTLEHSSDGINFSAIDTINSAGNSNTPLTYNFVDHDPFDSQTYYRLKQTNINGESVYSTMVSVEPRRRLEFVYEIFPTPNDGKGFMLRFYSEKMESADLLIIGPKNTKVYTETFVLSTHSVNDLNIHPKPALAPGTYEIILKKEPLNFHKTMVVE